MAHAALRGAPWRASKRVAQRAILVLLSLHTILPCGLRHARAPWRDTTWHCASKRTARKAGYIGLATEPFTRATHGQQINWGAARAACTVSTWLANSWLENRHDGWYAPMRHKFQPHAFLFVLAYLAYLTCTCFRSRHASRQQGLTTLGKPVPVHIGLYTVSHWKFLILCMLFKD